MITIKLAELYPKMFTISVKNAREEKIFNRHFKRMLKEMTAEKKTNKQKG